MIIGSSTGVLIKRGVIEEIGAATPIGKGKEKKVKKGAGKKSEAKEGVEGTKVGQGNKKRKTTSTRKQLVILEELGEVDSFAAEKGSLEKKVNHPPIPKIRVKTKVETSNLQTLCRFP